MTGSPTGTKQRAGSDEHRGAARIGGKDRCATERGGADQQQPAAADAIADRAHGNEQPGQHEAVDVKDPQLLHARRLKIPCNERKSEEEH